MSDPQPCTDLGQTPNWLVLKYIVKYWGGLNLFFTDGRIEIDNNTVERCTRPKLGHACVNH